MIIVSQDKTEVFNFSEVFRLYVDTWSNEEFATEPNCYCIKAEKASDNLICAFLGEYATEERAKEVLKEIARFYRMYNGMKYFKDSIKSEILEIVEEDGQDAFVYKMPED